MSSGLEINIKAAKGLQGLKYRFVKLAFKYITWCTVGLFRLLVLLTDIDNDVIQINKSVCIIV